MTTAFETLGLCPALVQTVTALGYTEPTPIQARAIPSLLAGRDVLGQAQTGTGKTAAFALPMLQRLDLHSPGVQGLVLAPTRELAVQVADAVYRYGHQLGVRVLPIYGGQSYERQQRRLAQGMPIVVGTPGRMLDLLRQGVLDLSQVRSLVLDEADAMLQMGFIEDVEALLQATPTTRQTTLVSATLSATIRQLALRYMRDPLTVAIDEAVRTVPQTVQRYYLIHVSSKIAALTRLLEAEAITRVLVFARTRVGTAELGEELATRGYPAEALHGDLSQAARETVLRRFRAGLSTILVATDVGARGLDIPEVSHVINFDLPDAPADYVHRVGRTGRAGRAGVAITLVTPQELPRLRGIEGYTRQTISHATLPSPATIQASREARFRQRLTDVLNDVDLGAEVHALKELASTTQTDVLRLAAAVMHLARGTDNQRPIEPVRELPLFTPRPASRRSAPAGKPQARAEASSSAASAPRPRWKASTRPGRRTRRGHPVSHAPALDSTDRDTVASASYATV